MMIAKINDISYPLYIQRGALDLIGEKIHESFPDAKVIIVSDDKVFSIYGKRVVENISAKGHIVNSIIVEQGESSKSLSAMEYVFDKLIEFETTRTDVIVALGGGVIGDLTGFVASCYLRGVNYIQVPTSLLSQVDSSIGGKTAINLVHGKNLVGAFYHPSMVIIDADVLKTLDDVNFACGMAEVIKTACIMDKELFDVLKNHGSREGIQPVLSEVITSCCKNKLHVVRQDEKDTGLRLTLNFGHTLGHALEKCEGATQSHGHAVAIGMAVITKSSEKLGYTKEGTYDDLVNMLKSFDLPYLMPDVDKNKVFDFAKRDKKTFNAKLKLILLKEIGECFINPIAIEESNEFIKLT